MKKETIISRLKKGGWLKKDGSIKTVIKDMKWTLVYLARGQKYHPIRWGNGWASLEGQPKYDNMTTLLSCLRIPYTEGNDAPRGGVTGKYIEVRPSARKRLAEIAAMIEEFV